MITEELHSWLKKHDELIKRRELAMFELLDVESKLNFVSKKILTIFKETQAEKTKGKK